MFVDNKNISEKDIWEGRENEAKQAERKCKKTINTIVINWYFS